MTTLPSTGGLSDPQTAELFRSGTVIPAHPLALTQDLKLDDRHQRALTRYYLAAGAGGVAVGVHTTQFEIHDPAIGLYRPVLELAAETIDSTLAAEPRPFIKVAGVVGDIDSAVSEAQTARSLGYDAVLLSPLRPHPGEHSMDDLENLMLERSRAVSQVLPTIGFYLQEAIRGPVLSRRFWDQFMQIPGVIGVKTAPFHRYRTLDVARALAESGRSDIVLYTGNDDSIVADLICDYGVVGSPMMPPVRTVGGLLGQWSVWTTSAVQLLDDAKAAHTGDDGALRRCVNRASAWTDANAALFDPAHLFAGSIAGVHEVLRRQGLMQGRWCLNPAEVLSPGQSQEIDRVLELYPWIRDDEFIAEHLDEWLR